MVQQVNKLKSDLCSLKKALRTVQQATPVFISCYPALLLVLLPGEHLQLLKLLRAQGDPFGFKGGGWYLQECRLWGGMEGHGS